MKAMGFLKFLIPQKKSSYSYKNLLQITEITCVWPESIRFRGHIVAFSHSCSP